VSCGPHKVCGWYFFNPILLFWGKWQHNRGVVGFLRAAQGVWGALWLSYPFLFLGNGSITEEWRVSCGPHKVCGWYFLNPILLFWGKWQHNRGVVGFLRAAQGVWVVFFYPVLLFWGKWQHNRGVVGFLRAAQGVWMVFFLSYSSFLGEVAAQ